MRFDIEETLETLEIMLIKIGAEEPFTDGRKEFTKSGLIALGKLEEILKEAAYMGLADDDYVYDYFSELKEHFGIEEED